MFEVVKPGIFLQFCRSEKVVTDEIMTWIGQVEPFDESVSD